MNLVGGPPVKLGGPRSTVCPIKENNTINLMSYWLCPEQTPHRKSVLSALQAHRSICCVLWSQVSFSFCFVLWRSVVNRGQPPCSFPLMSFTVEPSTNWAMKLPEISTHGLLVNTGSLGNKNQGFPARLWDTLLSDRLRQFMWHMKETEFSQMQNETKVHIAHRFSHLFRWDMRWWRG